jgi:hypothetical protein
MLSGLTVCIVLFSISLQVKGQRKIKTLSLDKYEELYNSIFPRISEEFDLKKHEYAIDVRLHPSFSAPQQVSIIKFQDGKLAVYIYKLADQKESLGDQIISLLQNGASNDIKTLAEQLKVGKTEIKKPDFLRPLVNDFFKRISLRKETRIWLDGVGYDVWYADSENKAYFSLSGSEKFEKKESPLITWARSLITKVEKASK